MLIRFFRVSDFFVLEIETPLTCFSLLHVVERVGCPCLSVHVAVSVYSIVDMSTHSHWTSL